MTHALTYFSTFSGIGGFEAAIQSIDSKAICVGYSEINKYADKVYGRHFPTLTNYGGIKAIDPANLQNFELLVGGFPCQAFSVAGKRKGLGIVEARSSFKSLGLLGKTTTPFTA